MTRDPDSDLQAQKLDLSLREANLDVHKAWLMKAEHLLDGANAIANGIISREVPEEERPESIATAVMLSSVAGAIGAFTNAALMTEAEQSQVEHLRAHVEHHEQQANRQSEIARVVAEQTEKMAQNLREAGIDVHTMPLGFPGIMLRKPDEDEPNS